MLKKEDINKMIFRNQIFGNNEKLKVITVEIVHSNNVKIMNCNVIESRDIYKNGKAEKFDSAGISNFNRISDFESSFVITVTEDNEDNLRKRHNINQVIFRIRPFIDMDIYTETSTDISIRNLDDKKIINRVTKSVRKDTAYKFERGKDNQFVYTTIIVNNNEDVVRVILHEKGYRGDNIYMLYSNDREDYLGEIFFDSVNEKVCSAIVTEEEGIDNKDIFSNSEAMKENYIRSGADEEVVYDQNGEVIRYRNKDIGIFYERVAYEGPEIAKEDDTNILAYTEKIYIGTNLIHAYPFLVTHNFSCDRISVVNSNLNGTTIKYKKDKYEFTERYTVFGDRQITRLDTETSNIECRTEKGYPVKASLEPEFDMINFTELDEHYAISIKAAEEMEDKYGFNFSNIYEGEIKVCPQNKNVALETICKFKVSNSFHSGEFEFVYYDDYDVKHILTYTNSSFGSFNLEQKCRYDNKISDEFVEVLKASARKHDGHIHYNDNYQSFIINIDGSMSNYQSDIYDPNVDNIYMRGIFGIPFLYHKVEEKEC